MKLKLIGLMTLCLVLLCAGACAQTLPGIDCFSPGLVKVNGAAQADAPVRAEATLTADNALYARDLTVLRSMLDGTVFAYAGEKGADSLSITRDGEALLSGALAVSDEGAALRIGGEVFRFASAQEALSVLPLGGAAAAIFPAEDPMGGLPVLERVPLASVAGYIEALSAGDEIAAGFSAVDAFSVERTMSDDGTRLVKINISGSIARKGEAPWKVEGFLRQPAGRAPKDTFEITFTQDEGNSLELLYSSLRENTITRKNKAGETTVDTTLKLAGKLGGSGISSRLRVKLTNSWTADGEALNEKITVSTTLTHQDKTPGRRMQRLNEVSGTVKNVIRLTTKEADGADSVYALEDKLTLEIIMDGNTFLAGGAQIAMTVGGEESGVAAQLLGSEAAQGSAQEALDRAVQAMSAALYPSLSEDAHERIEKGL